MMCLMSKMDLVKDKKGRIKREVGRYLDSDTNLLLDDVNAGTNPKFHALNKAVVSLVSVVGRKVLIRRSKIRAWSRSSRLMSCPRIR